MKWFRFYSDALNNPKVQRLPGDLFKTWINLLCLANEQQERGMLPSSVDDMAWALRMDVEELRQRIHTLQGQRLLDWDDEGNCFVPHDWYERQKVSDDVTARVTKHRNKPAEDETLHETPVQRFSNALDKNREDKNRIEEIREEKTAQAPDNFSLFFEEFWELYPKKLQKPSALKAAKNIPARDWDDVLTATRHYCKSTRVLRGFIKDAPGYLKNNYWRDFLNGPIIEATKDRASPADRPVISFEGRPVIVIDNSDDDEESDAIQSTGIQGQMGRKSRSLGSAAS